MPLQRGADVISFYNTGSLLAAESVPQAMTEQEMRAIVDTPDTLSEGLWGWSPGSSTGSMADAWTSAIVPAYAESPCFILRVHRCPHNTRTRCQPGSRNMPTEGSLFLERLLNGDDLSEPEARELMRKLTDESLPPALAGAVLAALRAKGETAEEVRGFAGAMQQMCHRVILPDDLPAADCAGTGGDRSGSLNLSSGSALVAAACGVPMTKHGNRSVSSKSGSADVLDVLGVPLAPDPASALACLEACGFTFLFAPYFHPAMKAVAPVRTSMGVRTVFNFLGPLVNPAAPPFYLFGAFDLPHARLLAESLSGLPLRRAFVVHGEPGWDEATPCGPFVLFDVRPGTVREERRDPEEYGLPRCAPEALAGGDAKHNAAALEAVLRNEDEGAHRDALVLAAGLVLEVTGRSRGLAEGIEQAREALASGAGEALLDRLRAFRARESA